MIAPVSVLLLTIYFASVQASTPPWSFIVIADWHGVEHFARDDTPEEFYLQRKWQLQSIKREFEGDFVALVGDMVKGEWYRQQWIDKFMPGKSPQQAVYDASVNCFTAIKKVFHEVGYKKIFYALGDHEIGDNPWEPNTAHTNSLDQYRKGFVDSLYLHPTSGEYIYKNMKLGNIHLTPYGTPFQYTSFAHVHKNILFVTIDVFKQLSSALFQKTSGGIGGNGVVTADVDGNHLKWLGDILREGRNDPSIKHIFVQGHVPVITPVQRINSSSMTFDRQEDSKFWKLLVNYGVDIYFAGEVHANTVLKDENSNLLQVSTRANGLVGLLQVNVNEDQIELRAYRDENVDKANTKTYTQAGLLTIDKTSPTPQISSNGSLHIVDLAKPILHFDFEQILPISGSRIEGLKSRSKQYLDEVKMQGNILRDVVLNKGEFGQNYNAPVGGVQIKDEGIGGTHSGYFDGTMSQMGIYARGPFVAGTIISVSMWLKTTATDEMLLLHYDRPWQAPASGLDLRNMFSITLKDGSPRVYVSKDASLLSRHSEAINDNGWHQIAAIMPHKSCKLSEVLLFIDGKQVSTSLTNKDTPLHFENFGHTSIGGVGFAGTDLGNLFPSWKPFAGYIDEVYLWQRRVYPKELRTAPFRRFKRSQDSKCTPTGKVVIIGQVHKVRKCRRKCKQTVNCVGFKTSTVQGSDDLQCTLFLSHPPQVDKDKGYCFQPSEFFNVLGKLFNVTQVPRYIASCRKVTFDEKFKDQVYPVLIVGWKNTVVGEVWKIITTSTRGECKTHQVAFGQMNIDTDCIVPKQTFETWTWQEGPYFDTEISEDYSSWGFLKLKLRLKISADELGELSTVVGGDFVQAAISKKTFTLRNLQKPAQSRTCYIRKVAFHTGDEWNVTVKIC